MGHEVLRQRGDVRLAIPQRRHLDRDHVQPVEEVLAELALGDRLREVAVGRGDDAHVHQDRLASADRGDLPIGEGGEEPDLLVQRHLSDLVQEQRATVRLDEPPVPASHVGRDVRQDAEQLGLDQRLWDGTAVHRHERPGPSGAAVVDDPREHLLPGAVLAGQEHRGAGLRRALCDREDPLHQRARSHDVLRLEAPPHLLTQLEVLVHQLLVGAPDLLLALAVLDRDRHELGEAFEQSALGVAEHFRAPGVVEIDRADDPSAQEHRHAHDRAQPHVDHALGERARIGRSIRDQQAPAALGHPLNDAAAEAHRVAARGRVHRSVLGDGRELSGLRVHEQQHAALGVQLLDRHAHGALCQLAQIGE